MPATLKSGFDLVIAWQPPQRHRRALIKEYTHSGNLRWVQALSCMIQDGPHLFHGYAGKPFDELIDPGPIFQVFEKSENRHTRPTKNPCAAYPFGITFDRGTSRPIQHDIIVARERQRVKLCLAR